ncbi:hypothetical protein ACPV5P_20140 [Vibrio mediterranei]|uniref:hypothetical protein n=1 Tax=Vibrio mediterranei TaxID=689 RepID=UPI00406971C2
MKNKYDKLNFVANVISLIFIGLMSVLVSYASLKVAENQNRISSTEYRPFFYVSYGYETVNNWLIYKSLDVYNIGAPVANAKVHVREFLVVNRINNGENFEEVFPILGYYFIRNPTGKPTGLLHTAWASENVKLEANLHEEVSTKEFSDEFGFTELKVSANYSAY